ncbi:uncharacterized protein LOC117316475 [Pecten maximus]|uniref:uncharacterized protein LOC117316475 n=2 Tax=Pecten maximus TaxID=6579 RepID=UPI00145910D2|nr:uncharacterized protein LOC117316475 [Pecten maximus]
MNSIHRSVLKQHFRQLASDIILTDTLLGAMYQTQIFERNMIDLIKAEKTEGDKVCKLLELLPKRGPDAFDLFLEVIQNDYPWLVAMLTASIKHETLTRAPTKPDFKHENDSARASTDLCAIDTDMDIKTKVSTFIHKQFGQSKRISESDKKTMIRWMSQTVHYERHRRLTSASSSAGKLMESVSMTTEDKCCGTDDDHSAENAVGNNEKILLLYQKLQAFKKTHNMSCEKQTEMTANQKQINGCLDTMATDVQYVMDKLDEIEGEVNKCYLMLGDRAKNCHYLSSFMTCLSQQNKRKKNSNKRR